MLLWFFFFKQKTAYEMCGRDWSSDVCSSDLIAVDVTSTAMSTVYNPGAVGCRSNAWALTDHLFVSCAGMRIYWQVIYSLDLVFCR